MQTIHNRNHFGDSTNICQKVILATGMYEDRIWATKKGTIKLSGLNKPRTSNEYTRDVRSGLFDSGVLQGQLPRPKKRPFHVYGMDLLNPVCSGSQQETGCPELPKNRPPNYAVEPVLEKDLSSGATERPVIRAVAEDFLGDAGGQEKSILLHLGEEGEGYETPRKETETSPSAAKMLITVLYDPEVDIVLNSEDEPELLPIPPAMHMKEEMTRNFAVRKAKLKANKKHAGKSHEDKNPPDCAFLESQDATYDSQFGNIQEQDFFHDDSQYVSEREAPSSPSIHIIVDDSDSDEEHEAKKHVLTTVIVDIEKSQVEELSEHVIVDETDTDGEEFDYAVHQEEAESDKDAPTAENRESEHQHLEPSESPIHAQKTSCNRIDNIPKIQDPEEQTENANSIKASDDVSQLRITEASAEPKGSGSALLEKKRSPLKPKPSNTILNPGLKRQKLSLAEICSRANGASLAPRVGLSRRNRVESLHRKLSRR